MIVVVATIVTTILIGGIIYATSRHQTALSPTPVPTVVFSGNTKSPASGTQTVDFTMKSGKLASGPQAVNLALGQYVLFHPQAFGLSSPEFYVDSYGEFEVDVDNADGSLSGEAYFKADKAGTFTYGIENEDTGAKTPLGQVVVK